MDINNVGPESGNMMAGGAIDIRGDAHILEFEVETNTNYG